MKVLVVIATVLAVAYSEVNYEKEEKEYHERRGTLFKERLIPFIRRLALEANNYTDGKFIISGHSIWYTLGSLLDSLGENEAHEYLNLPHEKSLRQPFYNLASSLEGFGNGVSFYRSKIIAVDETVEIKKDWNTFDDLPEILPEQLRTEKFYEPFGQVQKYVEAYQPNFPYSGHTVFVDHLAFEGSWTSAFSEKAVKIGPVYNQQGEQIGVGKYLNMKGKVRIAKFSDNNVKVLEVPLGAEEKHTMLFAVGDKVEAVIERILSGDIFSELKLTEKPIEVAIPRISCARGWSLGPIFKNIKDSKEFSDPEDIGTTWDASQEPGYYQSISVKIVDSVGKQDSSDSKEEIDQTPLEKDGFILDRPFLYALFTPIYQTDIKVPLIIGTYF